jgi:hypothetical protein
VQGRKPRYETEGNDYIELGIVGYEWSYTPGTGGSPFDQVMGDPAVSTAGSPIGEWGGSSTLQGKSEQEIKDFYFKNFGWSQGLADIKVGAPPNFFVDERGLISDGHKSVLARTIPGKIILRLFMFHPY